MFFLYAFDCQGRDAYSVSDVVLVDCLSGTNYFLNLFWGIVLKIPQNVFLQWFYIEQYL